MTFVLYLGRRLGNNCADVERRGENGSGVYTVWLNMRTVDVYCDIETAGGGWTGSLSIYIPA